MTKSWICGTRLVLLIFALACAARIVGTAASAAPVKQGAERLKADILGVFAHPDDETGVATVMAHYALGQGKTVMHAYMTRGEGGGNMVGTQSGPALGLLREVELRDCLTRLGVQQCFFLEQLDWAYTESLAATLRKWGHEETLGRLVRVIRAVRPEVILTMNPAPNPGQHGHHQAAGLLAIEAYTAAADASRFPEQLSKEGLTPWQTRKIYVGGGGTNATTIIAVDVALPDGLMPARVAAEALSNHRSQAFGNFSNAPWLSRPQFFTLAKSVVGYPDRETDLFHAVPPPGATLERAQLSRPPASPATTEFSLSFVPRPAIGFYQRWVKAHGVEHLAGRLRADVPLIAGEPNEVRLEWKADGETAPVGKVRVTVPDGWKVEPGELDVRRPAARKLDAAPLPLVIQVTPPAGRPADGELTATLEMGGRQAAARATGHPVPRATVRRVEMAPRLDGTDAGWASLLALTIAPTNLTQGRSVNEADSSAQVRLAHDRERLYVDVQVKDDRIVSNIAPNDIKGHWRSDSVEICIDPRAGSEDTMGCYKLGIFPFDQTGVVRAARDADARQGPIEETAPGTRLFSARTPGGYRIQVSIPFQEIGANPREVGRLGFNVIVYDGDKADAAPGENINKSRIAWSPRSGVQGRPEDWGRIDLEN
jgi:LmbE family N-acetylglucosaminyl deacetylase